jgi:hypothetical protein
MARSSKLIDRRLWGTWRSDRRRTFQFFKPKSGAKPATVRKLKSLFGKMTVRWTARRCHIELNGQSWSEPYEVVAKDANSVVVRVRGIGDALELAQIHFEGDYYWVATILPMNEYFRRID